MLVKFEQNRMVQTTRTFERFDTHTPTHPNTHSTHKKRVFYNHFWQRVDAILEAVSAAEIVV